MVGLLDQSTDKRQVTLGGLKNLAALLSAGSTFDRVFEVQRDRAAKIDLAKFAKIEGPVDHPAAKGGIDRPPAAICSCPEEVLDGDHPQAWGGVLEGEPPPVAASFADGVSNIEVVTGMSGRDPPHRRIDLAEDRAEGARVVMESSDDPVAGTEGSKFGK